jgi:hypothetical protein
VLNLSRLVDEMMSSEKSEALSVYYELTQCLNELQTDIDTVISYNKSANVVMLYVLMMLVAWYIMVICCSLLMLLLI